MKKVFIFDDLMLGRDRCQLLDGQTYHFRWHSGPGFGLFYNARRTYKVALVRSDAFQGCFGDLWEVSDDAFSTVDRWYRLHNAVPTSITKEAFPVVTTWTTPLSALRKAKMRQIDDYLDPSGIGGLPIATDLPPEGVIELDKPK